MHTKRLQILSGGRHLGGMMFKNKNLFDEQPLRRWETLPQMSSSRQKFAQMKYLQVKNTLTEKSRTRKLKYLLQKQP